MKRLEQACYLILSFYFLFSFTSCSDDSKEELSDVPVIEFDQSEYFVKIGESITLVPKVDKAVNPVFSWTVGGKIVSTETTYTFHADKLDEAFVNFKVVAKNGITEVQVKVTVTERDVPVITLADTQMAYIGKEIKIAAEVAFTDNTTEFTWYKGNEIVCRDSIYTFKSDVANADIEMLLKVTNKSGVVSKSFMIVVMPEPTPILFFDNGTYILPSELNDKTQMRKMSVCLGRSLVLAPVKMNMGDNITYEWKVDGMTQSGVTGEYFSFKPEKNGLYQITVTGRSEVGEAVANVRVECVESEGTYRRERDENSKYWANTCFQFIPAPGQFIDFQEGSTFADATAFINNQIKDVFYSGYVASLGAFGGYAIFGFDHSVDNLEGPDLIMYGNEFVGSNEPGVVWVMQDENGNQLPDDTWYELKGSETGKPETNQRATMTYFRPNKDNASIVWVSNVGTSGTIGNNGYHTQKSYFPMFITEESYTLTGTLLKNTFTSSGLEMNNNLDWGYVDNINSRVGFYIEDAIQQDGSPANLKYIDFVKVHTGQQAKGQAIGEISTEPSTPQDYHMR